MQVATNIDIPMCPHCSQKLRQWEVPSFNFSDGLGWGTNYLYVCFNDDCSFFVKGWQSMMEKYGQHASYRYMVNPVTGHSAVMPFMSKDAGKGNIMDGDYLQEFEAKEQLRTSQIKWYNVLHTKNKQEILEFLFAEDISEEVLVKSVQYIGANFQLDVIDQLRHHKFISSVVQSAVDKAIEQIHTRYFTQECPHCAEIIKARAKLCKFCKSELS